MKIQNIIKKNWLIFYIISAIIIFGIVVLIMGIAMDSLKVESCNSTVHILKGVNGITDKNTGFLSSGSVSKTSLLLDGGIIITLNKRIDKLVLNQPITIEECTLKSGAKTFDIVR